MMNDDELIKRVALGDKQAFKALYVRYYPLLHAHIYRITESLELAEEITQDAFVKLWSSRSSLTEVRNLGGYLYVISKNKALNALRQHIRETILHKEWQQEVLSANLFEPEDGLMYELLDQAIERLPPQQRQVFVLSRQKRMKYSEIASHMGISKETVKKYLQLATRSVISHIQSRKYLHISFLFLADHIAQQ